MINGPDLQKLKISLSDHGMINLSRTAIEKWNRPAATVDFITARGVDLSGLSQGMDVKFTFEIIGGILPPFS